MNILQVLPYFSPKFGGPFTSTYNTSKELAKLGHKVTIITTDFHLDKHTCNEIKKFGIKMVVFKCSFNLGLFLYSPDMKRWTNEHITEYDIIHMQEYRSYQNYIIWKAANRFNIPYILQARGSLSPSNIKIPIYLKFFKKIYDDFCGLNILNDSDRLIALTEFEKNEYKHIGIPEEKIEILPNGINFSSNNYKKGFFRNKYGIGSNEKIILYLGRIHRIKGIDLLIKAFDDLSKDFDNVRLLIAGPDDGFLEKLKKLSNNLESKNRIIFVGPLYGEKKFEAFSDSDIFVLPSKYEAFGNTIIESLACGTPVIVSEHCGIANTIHNICGLKFNYNKDELISKMKFLLENETILKEFSSNGCDLVFKYYDNNKIFEKLINLYNIVLEMRTG